MRNRVSAGRGKAVSTHLGSSASTNVIPKADELDPDDPALQRASDGVR
jgi:hypothetical protein